MIKRKIYLTIFWGWRLKGYVLVITRKEGNWLHFESRCQGSAESLCKEIQVVSEIQSFYNQ